MSINNWEIHCSNAPNLVWYNIWNIFMFCTRFYVFYTSFLGLENMAKRTKSVMISTRFYMNSTQYKKKMLLRGFLVFKEYNKEIYNTHIWNIVTITHWVLKNKVLVIPQWHKRANNQESKIPRLGQSKERQKTKLR